MTNSTKGLERLSASEQEYYQVFTSVAANGSDFAVTPVVAQLLRVGHLTDYEGALKLTDSGFQLFDFIKFKMTGDSARPLERIL